MNISVMQPTYLPWAGYFNLIVKAAQFIFLDDVQFSYQSWQQRNRIIVNAQPHILTVPVLTKGRSHQCICDVEVDETKHWRKKHLSTLGQAYARHPYGREVTALVEGVLAANKVFLMEINMDLIKALSGAMGMNSTFYRSSELDIQGSRSSRLLELCRHFGADTYLSPCGAQQYIEEDGVFSTSEIKVVYQDFLPGPYPQHGVKEFISHMSIIDLLANVGFEEGRKYVEHSVPRLPSAL